MPSTLLLDRLLLITDLFERDMARAFAGTQLSSARMAVLWTVRHSGPLTQQALAAALDVSARNISALVDVLEDVGYVRRAAHPTDRRARLIELTGSGVALMERTEVEHAELSANLLDAVQPKDRAALERGLQAVSGRLAKMVTEAQAASATETDGTEAGF